MRVQAGIGMRPTLSTRLPRKASTGRKLAALFLVFSAALFILLFANVLSKGALKGSLPSGTSEMLRSVTESLPGRLQPITTVGTQVKQTGLFTQAQQNTTLLQGDSSCSAFSFTLRRTISGHLLGNRRIVSRISVAGKSPFELALFHATGRSFLWGPSSALDSDSAVECALKAGLQVSRDVHGVDVARAVDETLTPEPVWLERTLPEDARLPSGLLMFAEDPYIKLYVDAVDAIRQVRRRSDGEKYTVPLMKKPAREGWRRIAKRLNGGGWHLDWGTGKSSHFACGMYSKLNAIDSAPKWCAVVKSTVPKNERLCGAISTECVDVGPLNVISGPIKGKTDPMYFSIYTGAIDTFRTPYYDTVLVDGRFRVACAMKALQYLRADSVLMLHDYTGDKMRLGYRRLEMYFDKALQAGDLAFFVPKPEVSYFDSASFPQFPESA